MKMGKGRAPCCDKTKVKRGPWSPTEDLRLINFVQNHGHSNWRILPKQAGLLRCGKSCRLRWINYLRPDVKRGNFTPQEEQTIIQLHHSFGNKWSKIASYLPGRTDNEIKNIWNTHLKKRLKNKSTTEQSVDKNEANDSEPNNSIPTSTSCTSCSMSSFENQNTEKEHADQHIKESESEKSFENQNTEKAQTDQQIQESESEKSFENQNTEKAQTDQQIQESESEKSFENQNTEKAQTDQQIQESESEKYNQDPSSDNSSRSSHASNFSSPNDTSSEFLKSEVVNNEATGEGKSEIPLEFDIDFWELLDTLDKNPIYSDINPEEKLKDGSKWYKLQENEHGQTCDMGNCSKGQNDVSMTLEPETDPVFDYYPIWPCSPQNLGI